MDFCMSVAWQVMLDEISKKNGSVKNVVLSPLSINMVLNMLASGSSGHTLEQFLEILGFQDINHLNSKSSTIMSLLAPSNESDAGHTTQNAVSNTGLLPCDNRFSSFSHPRSQGKGPLLNVVNALCVDHRFPLTPSYKETANTIYKAQVKNVDFVLQAEEVKNEVNSWAEKETNGLIKQVLGPETILTPPLCLANALYFKGVWKKPFNSKGTSPKDFHLLDGQTIKVDFMTEYNEHYMYGDFKDYQLLKLPYKTGVFPSNKQFHMYIFLPHTRYGLQGLVQKFNSDTSGILQPEHFYLRRVELERLWIPRMKFSYDFDVTRLIVQKGLTLPFDQSRAEFANMVNTNPVNAFVSTILQKAYVEVNEEGTEAAAVTCGVMMFGAAPRAYIPKPSFVADHPFMFMIIEDFSKLLIFTGAVVNPLLE